MIKLKTIAGTVTRLARQAIGGFGMYTELGKRHSTLPGDDKHSYNLEDFADIDDTDLWDTERSWRDLTVADDARLDFYVYDREELKDNLGILIRGGKVVAWNVVGDKLNGSYDAWRPIDGGPKQPKAFFKRSTS